jgi:predicted dehydrogenase
MIRIGIIGIGFMGYTHFEGARNLTDAKVTAIATRDEKKLAGDWTSIQGNFGPRGGQTDLSDVKCFRDYKDLLADPDIDLVDICLPTDLHEQVALDAIAAGKAVLVEKPIAIDIAAADRMVQAARDAGSLLMVGHVLPFFPEFKFAADVISSGKYGKLKAAHFRRVICPPDWSDAIADFRKLGGWGIDLHIHDNHFISHVCGTPQRVFSNGLQVDGFVNHVHSQYVFDDPELAVSCVSGGIAATGYQFGHGFELYLENATIFFDAGTVAGEWTVSRPLTLVTNDGKAIQPELDASDSWCGAFTDELQVAVDAVRSGVEPRILSGELARDALKLCHAEAKSIATRQAVDV